MPIDPCDIKALSTPRDCSDAAAMEAVVGSDGLSTMGDANITGSGWLTVGNSVQLNLSSYDATAYWNLFGVNRDAGTNVSPFVAREYTGVSFSVETFTPPTDSDNQIAIRVIPLLQLGNGDKLDYFHTPLTESCVRFVVTDITTELQWYEHATPFVDGTDTFADVLAATNIEGGDYGQYSPPATVGVLYPRKYQDSRYVKNVLRTGRGVGRWFAKSGFSDPVTAPSYVQFMDSKFPKGTKIRIYLNSIVSPYSNLVTSLTTNYCFPNAIPSALYIPNLSEAFFSETEACGANYLSTAYTLPSIADYPPDVTAAIGRYDKVSCTDFTVKAADFGGYFNYENNTFNTTSGVERVVEYNVQPDFPQVVTTVHITKNADTIGGGYMQSGAPENRWLAVGNVYTTGNTFTKAYIANYTGTAFDTYYLYADGLPPTYNGGNAIPSGWKTTVYTGNCTIYDDSYPTGHYVTSIEEIRITFPSPFGYRLDSPTVTNNGGAVDTYCTLVAKQKMTVRKQVYYEDYLIDTTNSSCGSGGGGSNPPPTYEPFCTDVTTLRIKATMRNNQLCAAWSLNKKYDLHTAMLASPMEVAETWTTPIEVVPYHYFTNPPYDDDSGIQFNEFGIYTLRDGRLMLDYNLIGKIAGVATTNYQYSRYNDDFFNATSAWSSAADCSQRGFNFCAGTNENDTYAYGWVPALNDWNIKYTHDKEGVAWEPDIDRDTKSVTSLTPVALTNSYGTVNCVGHGLAVNDSVTISGATGVDAAKYNGTYTVLAVLDADNFTYQLGGVTVSSATGTITANGHSVTSITPYDPRTTFTVAAVCTGHGYEELDRILIRGALAPDDTKYNGAFAIHVVDADNFTYEALQEPSAPATGTLVASRPFKYWDAWRVIQNNGGYPALTYPDKYPFCCVEDKGVMWDYDGQDHYDFYGSFCAIDSLGDSTLVGVPYWQFRSYTTPSSITQSAGVATVTIATDSDYEDGDVVTVTGANESGYNKLLAPIYGVSSGGGHTTFHYDVDSATSTPATGTLTVNHYKKYMAHTLSMCYLQSGWRCLLIWNPDTNNHYITMPDRTHTGFDPNIGIPVSIPNVAYKSVTSIVYAGAVATVTCTAHGFPNGSTVLIGGATGADSGYYNGAFVVTVTGADTFTYSMSGTPSANAVGALTAMCYELANPACMVGNGHSLVVVYLDASNNPKHKRTDDLGATWV